MKTPSLLRARLAFVILAGLLGSGVESKADLISGPTQIVPSTSIEFNGGFGSIDQIADGIGLESDGPPFNGYGPNAMSGVITLDLQGTFTLFGFRLANDINIEHEGIKDFQLSFFDESDQLISTTPILTAGFGMVASQLFDLGTVAGVSRVDLNVLSVFTENVPRIEVREVAFEGVQVPEPTSVLLSGIGATAFLIFRRRKS